VVTIIRVLLAGLILLFGGLPSPAAARGKPVRAINGVCGSANGTTVSTAPSTNLCSTGIASAVSGSGPWTWTCAGIHGGTTANCSANKTSSTPSTTMTIKGQSDAVISGISISTTVGPCIVVDRSTNITIQNANIGPCGANDSDAAAQGIVIQNGSSVNVYDNYIHVENQAHTCGDSHDGILVVNNGAGPVDIQGNVIGYNEQNVRMWNASNVNVIGNFVFNPRGAATCGSGDNLQGHQVQAWADDATPNANLNFSSNYVLNSQDTGAYTYAGVSSDALAMGVTNKGTISGNYVNYDSNVTNVNVNAAGIIADYKANNITISSNVLKDMDIGLAGGSGHSVSGNKVLIKTPSNNGVDGITINGSACPVSITGNYMSAFQNTGPDSVAWNQGYYNSGSCASPTLSSNVNDEGCGYYSGHPDLSNCPAYLALNPILTTNPPPLIPPLPKNCVATSPYSTQTSKSAC
jgi:hypothetical protein